MGDKTRDKEELAKLLEEKEFNIGQAMKICAEDMDLYIEVLKTAMEEGRRKLPIIRRSMEKRDYERYHIEVHALKHAMLAIGAMELSALSAEQERAVKEGDAECESGLRGSYREIRGVGCFSSERFRTVGERNKIKRRVLELSVFSAILFLIKMIKIKG